MIRYTSTRPTIVVLDMTWLHQFEQAALPVFDILPIYTAIEIITRCPPYEDCNEAIWHAFYHPQDPTVDPDDNVILMAELTIELLIQELYDRIEYDLPGHSGDYIFYRWVGQYALALISTDYTPPPLRE